MPEKNDNQRVKTSAAPNGARFDTSAQDQLWQRFDAMLQEFLKMEQTSPAVESRKHVKMT